MVFAIGEIVAILLAGLMGKNIPYTLSLFLAGLLMIIGGGLHALTVNVWMVLLARLLLGCSSGFRVIVHTYIGEEGTQMDQWRIQNAKQPTKFAVYIILSFAMNGGVLLGYGELRTYVQS